MIPYSRQNISKADIEAVVNILQSDFLTQGPTVPRFEKVVANYCGTKHAVAVSNATSALHIACVALNLLPGDWLWTCPNTFVASANCALYCGANIDFVDIDPCTYNMSVYHLEEKLEKAEKNGRLPKIVVPVHFSGQPCEMPTIYKLSQKYGFRIIEDASHAIGASYNNVKVGSCTHSHITVFSFHPVKIITSGEGGMAMTNNTALANHMRRLRTHGITNDDELMHSRPKNEIWNYQQIELGFNYRMTDIQAALGMSQMKRLDEFVNIRCEIAKRYDMKLRSLPITTPYQSPETYSSYHLYPIRIKKTESGKTQRQIYDALWQKNIAANLHYIPVHRQPFYEKRGFKVGDFVEAEGFHQEVISLPIFPGFSIADQNLVVESITQLLLS